MTYQVRKHAEVYKCHLSQPLDTVKQLLMVCFIGVGIQNSKLKCAPAAKLNCSLIREFVLTS